MGLEKTLPSFPSDKGTSQPQDQEEFSRPKEGRCNISIWMFQGMFGEVYLEVR